MSSPADDFDATTQDLMKGYATEAFEVAMYEALKTYAAEIGDAETAELAARHLREEQEAAQKLWPLIAPTAARAARVLEELMAANTPRPATDNGEQMEPSRCPAATTAEPEA